MHFICSCFALLSFQLSVSPFLYPLEQTHAHNGMLDLIKGPLGSQNQMNVTIPGNSGELGVLKHPPNNYSGTQCRLFRPTHKKKSELVEAQTYIANYKISVWLAAKPISQDIASCLDLSLDIFGGSC